MYILHSACSRLTVFLSVCLLIPGLVFPAGPNPFLKDAFPSPDGSKPSAIEYIDGIGGETYAFEAQGSFLYLCYGNRLEIYQVDSSGALLPGGRLRLPDYARDIQVEGDRAYLAIGKAGLQIVDIGDPNHPRLLSSYDSPGAALSIKVEGRRAYLADIDSVQILDVSLPGQPVVLGSYPTPVEPSPIISSSATYVEAAGNILYVIYTITGGSGLHYTTRLSLVDVSDPAHPSLISFIDVKGAYQVQVVGGFAYLSHHYQTFQMIDVRDPAHPVRVRELNCGWGDVLVNGGLAYLSCQDELRIMDVKDPAAPAQAGSIPIAGYSDLALTGSLLASLSHLLNYGQPNIILQIFDLSIPLAPKLVKQYSFVPASDFLEVQENPGRIYARPNTWGHNSLNIFDITDPSMPVVLGTYVSSSEIQDVEAVGNLIYLGASAEGLKIVDVSNPGDPQLLGSLALPDGDTYVDGSQVEVSGGLAFVAGLSRPRLEIIDIRDPRHPVRKGHTAYFAAIHSFYVAGNTAYLSVFDGAQDGLAVFDIQNPDEPKLLKFYPGYLSIAYVEGDLGYGLSAGGLEILDLTLPEALKILSVYPVPGGAYTMSVKGGYVALNEKETGALLVLDVHDPGHPVISARFDLSELVVEAIHWYGQFLYVSTVYGGLQILWFAPPVEAVISTEGGKLISASDGAAYTFPAGTFSTPVKVTHFLRYSRTVLPGLLGTGHAFEVSGEDLESGRSVQPGLSFSLSVQYDPSGFGSDFEKTLAIYAWDSSRWVREPTSRVDPTLNLVSAEPDHFGSFAVLGEGQRVFLPLVGKMGRPVK